MLEVERDGLVLGAFDADQHGAIRGEGVVFERNRAGLRGCNLQDVVIPLGLRFEVLASVNRGAVLAIARAVVVEEGLGGPFILETARDDDDALMVADRHRTGLNDWLAGKVALGGDQRPGAVQDAVVARQGGEREQERCQGNSRNRSR